MPYAIDDVVTYQGKQYVKVGDYGFDQTGSYYGVIPGTDSFVWQEIAIPATSLARLQHVVLPAGFTQLAAPQFSDNKASLMLAIPPAAASGTVLCLGKP